MATKSKSSKSKSTKKTSTASTSKTMEREAFDAALASLHASVPSAADRRKELLARVAGSIAAGLVTSPSPSITKPEGMAAVAVDIAEEILLKAGIVIVESRTVEETGRPAVDAAS